MSLNIPPVWGWRQRILSSESFSRLGKFADGIPAKDSYVKLPPFPGVVSRRGELFRI